jgi:hypothetical protein
MAATAASMPARVRAAARKETSEWELGSEGTLEGGRAQLLHPLRAEGGARGMDTDAHRHGGCVAFMR